MKFAAMENSPLESPVAEDSQKQIANTQLVLVPLPIGELSWGWMNTPNYIEAIKPIMHWVAEDARTLRRFLSSLKVGIPLNDLDIFEFNVRTPKQELEKFFKDIKHSKLIGVASEAGMPCIADPGAVAVALAHQRGWDVKPIMGPNSLMLALAGSGLTGQTFTFHGYPPINENEIKQLTTLLNNKATDKHSHLFIETPYRTDRLLQFFCKNLPQDMLLCIAKDLHSENESIVTQPISAWKRKVESLGKSPCVFIVGR
jgi:16S rRNA (cytidine1402-2'-O)-methyltransferase